MVIELVLMLAVYRSGWAGGGSDSGNYSYSNGTGDGGGDDCSCDSNDSSIGNCNGNGNAIVMLKGCQISEFSPPENGLGQSVWTPKTTQSRRREVKETLVAEETL
ncbi:hypothetical protein PoB_001939100 [Plakobranchus ocellatus]|uniref:Uncharacterized protein n=1 Tax=Plakobranchus ocellatus TaxID=259542 RepID=A0AAV3Z0P4_9GAST|nr:hypothetical protein PoB_001939100 [Plakobranchus ocellatus]